MELDLFSQAVLTDPYPHYRRLRDEAPCFHDAARNLWVLSRFDDVVAATKNHAVFSSTGGVGLDWHQRPMMPMYDPPEHTRMRRLVARHFTPAAAATFRARIEANVEKLLDEILASGSCELVHDFLIPVSLGTIAELIGVPPADRGDLRRWSQGTIEDLAGGLDAEAHARVEALRREFIAYLKDKINQRHSSPALEHEPNDVLSLLTRAGDEDRLSPKEVVAFGVLLLVAGFETTVNGMANGLLALLENEGELRKLRADPSMAERAVEEMIRYDGPVQSFFRNTLSEVAIAGSTIPKGVKVCVLFASANRDERHFADPDSFRIDRSPNDHIGFGSGIHFCLGAPLARQQMSVMLRALVRRTRLIERAAATERYTSILFRGVKKMPLRLQAV